MRWTIEYGTTWTDTNARIMLTPQIELHQFTSVFIYFYLSRTYHLVWISTISRDHLSFQSVWLKEEKMERESERENHTQRVELTGWERRYFWRERKNWANFSSTLLDLVKFVFVVSIHLRCTIHCVQYMILW